MLKNNKGFTLIELMIVVAIIGILAAIAIPNFRNYQLKAKTSEAKVNLSAIATSQESYFAEYDTYKICAANPAAVPGRTKDLYTKANTDFKAIGFEPKDASVYYQYAVAAPANAGTFSATATGDVDGDGTTAVYTVTQSSPVSGPIPVEAF